ncbi:hypothetical protein T265_11403 [Opisthorchis viverrini]|uniref:Uncharacterized protein n=1 Tax=Opisthorchis viverrini TaxID=6198 RepID=A0A074Z9L2_OPIVI|nr:hypothetical protein T265_11403 [Opisthorchis viverrini]KER19935.1 hypothetical protein T265_11403 [Opisthorchis viverrini]
MADYERITESHPRLSSVGSEPAAPLTQIKAPQAQRTRANSERVSGAQWLECQFTDRKARRSNPTSAS